MASNGDADVRVALFTHNFLEPTHHAIAQLMGAMDDCRYVVFAKRFEDHFSLENVVDRIHYTKGPLQQLNTDNFDLVHAIYDGKTAIRAYQAAKMKDLPFVVSFHGGFDIHAKIHDQRYRDASRALCEAANAVTVPCERDLDDLCAIGVSRSVEILPVPVVTSIARDQRQPQKGCLLLVARLVPKKGIDIAIKAIAELPGYNLDIVGDGELELSLRELISALGLTDRVRLCGHLPLGEVERKMLRAFALLHPARVASDGNAEGTPQVILLAQELGLPVISTATGSLGMIVQHRETGLLVPDEDPHALAREVRILAKDEILQQKLGELGKSPERRLSAVASKLREIYTSVCREARCR